MIFIINALSYNMLALTVLIICTTHILVNLLPDPKLQLITKLATSGMLLICVFFLGAVYVNENIKQKTQEQIGKVILAEQQALEVNKDLNAKSQVKVKTIRLKGTKVIEYIDREVRVYDSTCTIPETFIQAHNMAVEK